MDKLIRLVIHIITHLPVIGKRLRTSTSYALGQIGGAYSFGDYRKCFELAHSYLSEMKGAADTDKLIWWEVFRYATLSAAKLQGKSEYCHLGELLENGYDLINERIVAETLVKLSMLAFYFHDKVGMVKYAELAAHSDNSWGEPDFLLGWYQLPSDDSVSFLKKAIKKDKSYLDRIKTDAECLKYPELIEEIAR